MLQEYMKDFPRGDRKELKRLDAFLSIATDHLNALHSSLSLLRNLRGYAEEANSDIVSSLKEIEVQGAFNTYLNLCFLDYTVIYKNALSAIHLWEDIHSLRQGYLLIYEALKTYQSHSKHLKDMCSKAQASEIEFLNLSRKIKQFKKHFDYDNYISKIRNYAIGHIEKDPVNFFINISEFDEEQAFTALKEFVSILVDMQRLSESIYVNYTRTIMADASWELAGIGERAAEINELIDALNQQPFIQRNEPKK